MNKFLVAILVTVSTSLTFAGEVLPQSANQKGINESVTIQNNGSNWGYTYELTGFYMGKGQVNIVPVTRESAKVLNSLKKDSRYKCILKNSTFIPSMTESEVTGGTYFVIDIDCN